MTRAPEGVNERFHELYDGARRHEILEVPVLVVLQDVLLLVHAGTRRESTYTSEAFRFIKTIAHVPVAIFCASREKRLEGAALDRFASWVTDLRASLAEEPMLASHASTGENLLALLAVTEKFLRRVTAEGRIEAPGVAEFALATGPRLLQCTRDATCLQLAALHDHTQRLLAALTEDERSRVEVVVAGAHQARVRSLAMQYFEKLLDEAPGAEVRLAYAEGIEDVEGALALVGTRNLDRVIALAFFGDAHRLQRDVLGDAATEQLRRLVIPPLR